VVNENSLGSLVSALPPDIPWED